MKKLPPSLEDRRRTAIVMIDTGGSVYRDQRNFIMEYNRDLQLYYKLRGEVRRLEEQNAIG